MKQILYGQKDGENYVPMVLFDRDGSEPSIEILYRNDNNSPVVRGADYVETPLETGINVWLSETSSELGLKPFIVGEFDSSDAPSSAELYALLQGAFEPPYVRPTVLTTVPVLPITQLETYQRFYISKNNGLTWTDDEIGTLQIEVNGVWLSANAGSTWQWLYDNVLVCDCQRGDTGVELSIQVVSGNKTISRIRFTP